MQLFGVNRYALGRQLLCPFREGSSKYVTPKCQFHSLHPSHPLSVPSSDLGAVCYQKPDVRNANVLPLLPRSSMFALCVQFVADPAGPSSIIVVSRSLVPHPKRRKTSRRQTRTRTPSLSAMRTGKRYRRRVLSSPASVSGVIVMCRLPRCIGAG